MALACCFGNGSYSVVFLHPTFPNEEITCRGVIADITETDGGQEVEIEIWTENGERKMTSAGWAKVPLEAGNRNAPPTG